jgi:hypothetical protein
MCGLPACAPDGEIPDAIEQAAQPVTGQEVVTHLTGDIIVNGQPVHLEIDSTENDQSITGAVMGHVIVKPPWELIEPIKDTGKWEDLVVVEPGQSGTVVVDFGPSGQLVDDFVVAGVNPLTYEHHLTGQITAPPGPDLALPIHKSASVTWLPGGTGSGSVTISGTTVTGQAVTRSATYSITYQGPSATPLPLTVSGDTHITSYSRKTGAFSGTHATVIH